jgi:hypothetical protein
MKINNCYFKENKDRKKKEGKISQRGRRMRRKEGRKGG